MSKVPWVILSLFVLALVVRLGAGVAMHMNGPLSEDEPEYFYPAQSIMQGHGYLMIPQQATDDIPRPTAYRMPGASLLLAGVMKVAGVGIPVARSLSIFMASLAAPLMFLLARKFVPTPAAILAGVGCALYPTFIVVSRQILSEPYFMPLMLLSLLLTLKAYESKSMGLWLLAGLSWGISTLVRPHGAPMAGLIGIYVLWRVGWRPMMIMACGVLMFMLPWVIRNQMVFHKTILFANESGETLLGSNNPYVLEDPKLHGVWIPPMRIPEYVLHMMPIRGEVERNQEQVRMAMDYLKANPGQILPLVWYKTWRWLTPITASGGINRIIVLSSYGVLLVLLALGFGFRIYRNQVALHLALLCTSVLFLVTAVYWGNLTRGRLPLEMIWMPWGAWSAWILLEKLAGRKTNYECTVAATDSAKSGL